MSNEPGFLISLEGIDGSGKTTQAQRLQKNLRRARPRLPVLRFATPTKRIRPLLEEMHRRGASPKEFADLFLQDFAQEAPRLKQALARGVVLLIDRWIHSTLAYQAAMAETEEEGRAVQEYIRRRARKLRLPWPDLVIFLEIPPSLTPILLDARGGRGLWHDLERSLEFESRVAREYQKLAETQGFVTVKNTRDSEILPIEEVASAIWRLVGRILVERGFLTEKRARSQGPID